MLTASFSQFFFAFRVTITDHFGTNYVHGPYLNSPILAPLARNIKNVSNYGVKNKK